MSEILTFNSNIEQLIQRVIHTVSKVMNADRTTLFLVDEATGELWSKVAQGEENCEIRFPLDVGFAGWALQHDELVNIKDAYNDPRFNPEVDRRTGYLTRSVLCGPVKNIKGNIIGVIQVINKNKGTFNQNDENLFCAFAYHTAILVENFFQHKKILANHEKMAVFLDVAASVSQTPSVNNLIRKITQKISEILETERSALFLLDRKTGELWSKVNHGAEVSEIRFPCSTGLAGHVASTGQLLNIIDAQNDPRFNPFYDQEPGSKTKSVLCIPVFNKENEIIGIIQAINKKSGGFEKEDEELLQALTFQIAVALENAQLYEHTANMKNYLETIHQSITNGIITLRQFIPRDYGKPCRHRPFSKRILRIFFKKISGRYWVRRTKIQ